MVTTWKLAVWRSCVSPFQPINQVFHSSWIGLDPETTKEFYAITYIKYILLVFNLIWHMLELHLIFGSIYLSLHAWQHQNILSTAIYQLIMENIFAEIVIMKMTPNIVQFRRWCRCPYVNNETFHCNNVAKSANMQILRTLCCSLNCIDFGTRQSKS